LIFGNVERRRKYVIVGLVLPQKLTGDTEQQYRKQRRAGDPWEDWEVLTALENIAVKSNKFRAGLVRSLPVVIEQLGV